MEKRAQDRFLVRTAVVGGGFWLKAGQVVDRKMLGAHAEALEEAAAIERIAAGPRIPHRRATEGPPTAR